MAKLYFRYGSMSCGKTLDLLKTKFNYNERGKSVIIFTSKKDDRYGKNVVKSRIGIESDAIGVDDTFEILKYITNLTLKPDCILVDEVQFLTEKHIMELSDVVDSLDISVICYGLKSDFKQELFPGSKSLLSICDVIENIPVICWCGKKATVNARIIDNKIVYSGEQVLIGGNDCYLSLCRKHWKEGKIKKD